MRSTPSTVPRASAAVASISLANALTSSRPLEFAVRRSCPAALNFRAGVPLTLPVPMIAISLSHQLNIRLHLFVCLAWFDAKPNRVQRGQEKEGKYGADRRAADERERQGAPENRECKWDKSKHRC